MTKSENGKAMPVEINLEKIKNDFSSRQFHQPWDIRNSGILRQVPEFFYVEEVLGFEPQDGGEHIWLFIEKTGRNTLDVVRDLSRFLDIPQKDIGYSGLKDRHAVTRQWFSVRQNLKTIPDWPRFDSPNVRILRQQRHSRKLKRGTHQANRFRLRIVDIEGELSRVEENLERIRVMGFANYFGEQRFGRARQNLFQGTDMLLAGKKIKNRFQRSMALSAIRSWLFNVFLDRQIQDQNWLSGKTGDIYLLDGSNSFFVAEAAAELAPRLASFDIHPTGPLWGRPAPGIPSALLDREKAVLADLSPLALALENQGLDLQRRALRAGARDLSWEISNRRLDLEFQLPRGCYATSLVSAVLNTLTAR